MVCDGSAVELLAWERTDLRVHSELDSQHCLVESGVQETLEQALAIASLLRVPGKGGSWQLLLVTYQNDSLGSMLEGNHSRGLSRLASFIYD